MDKIEKANFDCLDIARFWMHVKISSKITPFSIRHGHCWEWQGTLFTSGYGHFCCHYKSYRAHRVSYYLYNGKIAKDKFICHKCDNVRCVNPMHLFEGSPIENVTDMKKKKRNIVPGKHKNNSSKFHGVYKRNEKKSKVWRVIVSYNYKQYRIGDFDSEEEAARAYDTFVKKNKFNKPLNFNSYPNSG